MEEDKTKPELTGTCRWCGKEIHYRYHANDDFSWTWLTRAWYLPAVAGEERTKAQDRECGDGSHVPKEWCSHVMDRGVCHRRVKPEDIIGELYSCGIHMRHFKADMERARALEESRVRQAEAQAERNWEYEIYSQAQKDLVQIFAHDPRVSEEIQETHLAYRDRHGNCSRLNKKMAVDILDLRDAILSLLQKAKEEFSNG